MTLSDRPEVLLDCDPGHDDVYAIAVAAKYCEVLGITTVAGNSPIENTTRNAIIAADLFGLAQVPVHRGASGPIIARDGETFGELSAERVRPSFGSSGRS